MDKASRHAGRPHEAGPDRRLRGTASLCADAAAGLPAGSAWLRRIISAATPSNSEMAGARDAALRALIAFRRDGAWPESALKRRAARDGPPRGGAGLPGCATACCRTRMLLDHWLSGFVRGKLQPVVRDILRLAAYQLCFLDRIPPSAAVNEAVEQTRRLANQQAARLVNGVLRNLLRAMPLALPDDLSLRATATRSPSCACFWRSSAGRRRSAFCRPTTKLPQTVLQVNPLRGNAAALLEELPGAQPHPWLPGCLTVSGPVEQTAAFHEGRVYVQDAAAHLAWGRFRHRAGYACLTAVQRRAARALPLPADAESRYAVFLRYPPAPSRTHQSAAQSGWASPFWRRICRMPPQPVPAWRSAMDVVLADVPCLRLGVIHGKSRISAITSPRRSFARPAACHSCAAGGICPPRRHAALQHLHDPAPGKRGCGGGLPAHASGLRPGERAVARGLRHRAGSDGHAASGQHETDGFICKFRRKP